MARCYYLDYESNGNLKLLPHYEREDSEQIHSDSSKSIRTISKIIIERRLHYVQSISRSLQLLHGLQWLVRLRLGFQLLE